MKKALGIILIILGAAMSIWSFMVVVRMLLNSSLSGTSQVLAFLFYLLLVGAGIALIFLGRRLRRNA